MKRGQIPFPIASRFSLGSDGYVHDPSSAVGFETGFNFSFVRGAHYSKRDHMNELFCIGSQNVFDYMVGNKITPNTETAEKIGGYPHLAQLVDEAGRRIISLKDNNFSSEVDFGKGTTGQYWSNVRNPEHWRRLNESEWFDACMPNSRIEVTFGALDMSTKTGSDVIRWHTFIGYPQGDPTPYILFCQDYPTNSSVTAYKTPIAGISGVGEIDANLYFIPSEGSGLTSVKTTYLDVLLPAGTVFASNPFNISATTGSVVRGFSNYMTMSMYAFVSSYTFFIGANSVEYYLVPESRFPSGGVSGNQMSPSIVNGAACVPIGYEWFSSNSSNDLTIYEHRFSPDCIQLIKPGRYFIAAKFNGPLLAKDGVGGKFELVMAAPFIQHRNALTSNKKQQTHLNYER